ncbi:MAG TPA: peptidylprolyl isomerase [Myxococcaceae bacterium]|nr:peptidylprolyl isomerase [Myxococcaceae bacterium]
MLALGASKAGGTHWMKAAREGKDLYATFKTSQGDIVVHLFSKDAPKTVENFVGLATGEKEWIHPATGEKSKKPLYDGVIFHRVIPNFMIQGGDPLGQGTGGPGYKFEDEFQSGRRFDKPGILAMANAGPNTNGSQFFITVAPTPHLNNRHTIFGEVVQGYDVAAKISEVPRDRRDKPNEPVVIKTVQISDKAPKGVAAAKGEQKK